MMDVKKLNVKYITDKSGTKKEVILSIEDFEDLLEDIEDLVVALERQNEDTLDHDSVLRELKKDGML